MASISDAIAHQTSGIGYAADAWTMATLENGVRVYKMMPAAGPYYFNYDGYREFGANPQSMYEGLQVRVSKRFSMRVVVVEYTVMSTFECPMCQCEANVQFGGGGAQQYFIDDADRDTFLYQTSPGWGLDGKGIGFF
jgi:hypothetical protein